MATKIQKINPKAAAPAANNGVFVVDDGTKEITLTNPYGRVICVLHVRTSDISIIDRYNEITDKLDDVVKPLKSLSINADGTSTFEADREKLRAAENVIKKQIDALLDTDGESDAIFAKRNPFSSVGGYFFVERVLEVLGNIIVQSVQEETEKAKARMAKYLDDLTPEENGDAGTTADNA